MRACTHESKHFFDRSLFVFCCGVCLDVFLSTFPGCPVCVCMRMCMCACRCVCVYACVWGVVVVYVCYRMKSYSDMYII